jgi:SnoaL-like domain
MKKILGLCGVFLLITVGVLAYVKPGQIKSVTLAAVNAPPTTDAAKNDEAATSESEIRGILERYYEIARTGDREALKNFSREISAPEYKYSSELGVMDKAAAIRHFDALDLEFVSAGFNGLTVQVHGGDTAIAKYLDISTVKANGIVTKKPMQLTNVWVKQNGAWQIVAEHSSFAAPTELLPRNRFADNVARR